MSSAKKRTLLLRVSGMSFIYIYKEKTWTKDRALRDAMDQGQSLEG
jgi:hypothetical protein